MVITLIGEDMIVVAVHDQHRDIDSPQILSIDGKPFGYRATLCRCGASENKQLCASSDAKVGLRST